MFKVGIVGVGYVGNIHLTKFSAIGGVEITAIQDKDAKSVDHAKKNFDVKNTYRCHKHLLKNEVLDLVVICVPNHLHFPLSFREQLILPLLGLNGSLNSIVRELLVKLVFDFSQTFPSLE